MEVVNITTTLDKRKLLVDAEDDTERGKVASTSSYKIRSMSWKRPSAEKTNTRKIVSSKYCIVRNRIKTQVGCG